MGCASQPDQACEDLSDSKAHPSSRESPGSACSSPGGLKLLHDAIRAGKLSAPYIVLNDVNITSGAYSYQRYGKYGYSSNHTYVYGYGNKRSEEHTSELQSQR